MEIDYSLNNEESSENHKNIKDIEKKINEEEIKDKNNNLKKGINPISFQLFQKMKLEDIIISIKELSGNRIGILSINSSSSEFIEKKYLLSIYSLNNFKLLSKIEAGNNNSVIDFIELKNLDLIIWTKNKVFVYHLLKKEYKLHQTINETFEESEEEEEFFSNQYKNDAVLITIKELTNGNLISVSHKELQIYSKVKDKYLLLSKHKIKENIIEIEDIIEISPNEFILLNRYHYFFWGCSRNNYSYDIYSIYTYDIEKEALKKIKDIRIDGREFIGKRKISYLTKNEYLLIKYGYILEVYNIKDNMALVYQCNDIIDKENEYNYFFGYRNGGRIKSLKDEMNIEFLCDLVDDLIIVRDEKDVIKVYEFRDKLIKFYGDFPIQIEELKGIIKLKNNNLIMYSSNELYNLNHL